MTIRRGKLTKQIGERVALRRIFLGWSQTELADKLGVSQTQVSVWESGSGIHEATLKRIADVLGTSVKFFVTGEDFTIDTILLKEPPSDYRDDLRAATKLCISGLNLGRFIPNDLSVIEAICAKKDGHVKALLMDGRDDNACKFGAAQEYGDADSYEEYRSTILLARNMLRPFIGPKLELRMIEYPIPFGLDIVDADPPAGIAYVRGYPFRKEPPHAPRQHELDPSAVTMPDQPILKFHSAAPEHAYWYNFYRRQFYIHWAMAKPPR